jgi:hypothetical protein
VELVEVVQVDQVVQELVERLERTTHILFQAEQLQVSEEATPLELVQHTVAAELEAEDVVEQPQTNTMSMAKFPLEVMEELVETLVLEVQQLLEMQLLE